MGEDLSNGSPAPGPDREEPAQQDPYAPKATLPPDYTTPTTAKTVKHRNLSRSILEFIGILASAIVIAYLLQAFIVKPFQIPSGSMEPTLMPGDRVLVNRLAYKYGSVQRGDVIVFKSPSDPDIDYIKRVIAVEGDTIEVRRGEVLVNGEPQVEDYVHVNDVSYFRFNVVPPGTVFVMGDNRTDSQDSRAWKVPWLSVDSIIGKAFMIYWPPSRLGGL